MPRSNRHSSIYRITRDQTIVSLLVLINLMIGIVTVISLIAFFVFVVPALDYITSGFIRGCIRGMIDNFKDLLG